MIQVKVDPNLGNNIHYEFHINTGDIYSSFYSRWEEIPRSYFEKMEESLYYILTKYKKVTFPWNGDRNYFDSKHRQLAKYREMANDPENEPFMRYFLYPKKAGGEFDLIGYDQNCIISYKEDKEYFDLFFSLRLFLLNEMKIFDFLNFQRELNFKNEDFKTFLELLLVKYHDFLKNGKIEILLNKYISEKIPENAIPDLQNEKTTKLKSEKNEKLKNNTEYTQSRQVLAIYYFLIYLKIENAFLNKADFGRLIHLFSGVDLPIAENGSEKLDNSVLYKKVKSLFGKTDKASFQDLQFVLNHFKKLSTNKSDGINEIIGLIEKDIESYREFK